MKTYYIEYTRNFANTYSLYWADESNKKYIKNSMERISRKDALYKVKEENYRRKYDSAMSGFATNKIYPVDYRQEVSFRNIGDDFYLEPNNAEHRIMEWYNEKTQKNVQKELDKIDF